MEQKHNELLTLLNSMFQKDSLRKNSYLFNSLNHNMEISIRTIVKERRVSAITHNYETIIEALKECQYVEIVSPHFIRIILKGDILIVRVVKIMGGYKMVRKDVTNLGKQMKYVLRENKDQFIVEFQSHAALKEFTERLKGGFPEAAYEWLEKDPYEWLEESINQIRREKKTNYNISQMNEAYHASNNYNYYQSNYNQQQYQQYPVFVRKAVDSEQEEEKPKYKEKPIEKVEEKEVPRFRLNSEEFPSFDKVSLEDQKE